ncbi:hypothetical protein MYX07_01790 [Patescibacteria group bacterium AH-259-L07]|nr:hypothetical protein [Patescibacteria group bacterium AH-259-L07]
MKKLTAISGLILIVLLTPMHAQNQKGWNVEANLMHLTTDFNQHMLSECMAYLTADFDSLGFHVIENDRDCDKVFLNLPTKTIIMSEISYAWDLWRIGVRAWYFNSFDEELDQITTPTPVENKDGSITFYRGVIFIWLHHLGALANTLEESGWSDIDWQTKNSLTLWTAETYIAQTLSKQYEMRIGIKVADIVNKQTIETKQWAYVNPYYQYIWDNRVTLSQKAEARTLVIGPYVGFILNTKYVQALIQGAPLFTPPHKKYWSDMYGNWDDTDKIDVDLIETDSLYYKIYYDGDFPFRAQVRKLIPAGDINVKLTYPIEYKNMVIRLGVGVFGAVFLNVPIAPIWQVPDRWSWRGTTHWKTREKDLTFYGWTIHLSIHWKGGI